MLHPASSVGAVVRGGAVRHRRLLSPAPTGGRDAAGATARCPLHTAAAASACLLAISPAISAIWSSRGGRIASRLRTPRAASVAQ